MGDFAMGNPGAIHQARLGQAGLQLPRIFPVSQ